MEIQHPDGTPVPGFALEQSLPMVGDAVEQTVTWRDNPPLPPLAGRPVRLRFVMAEADLFSLRFC